MIANTMTNENPMTTNTDNAIRVTNAIIGFGMITSVIAGLVPSALIFGLSMAGSFLIFTSIISKTSPVGSIAALAIMGLMLLSTGGAATPMTVAVMSLASIAIVTVGLIGSTLPESSKNLSNLKLINAHISEVSNTDKAANDDRRIAA